MSLTITILKKFFFFSVGQAAPVQDRFVKFLWNSVTTTLTLFLNCICSSSIFEDLKVIRWCFPFHSETIVLGLSASYIRHKDFCLDFGLWTSDFVKLRVPPWILKQGAFFWREKNNYFKFSDFWKKSEFLRFLISFLFYIYLIFFKELFFLSSFLFWILTTSEVFFLLLFFLIIFKVTKVTIKSYGC